ncbi:MAG: hypothetical protein QN172_10215 [Armatimonadota bacterium]|nr:hypothetical protein [Armatimonadota bacterium]MDR7440215.1 hypothetical protein [Armatimonadota bacterium]MDR7602813.1 hypothetical protein [Armatimonadota bacterium]
MQLTEEQLAALRRLASRRVVSISELVRWGVDALRREPGLMQVFVDTSGCKPSTPFMPTSSQS